MRPRVVVVAPTILDELVELAQYVGGFEFDLVELRRFEDTGENFAVVTRKAAVGLPPPGVAVQEDWDWDKYAADLKWSPERISRGKKLFDEIERKVAEVG